LFLLAVKKNDTGNNLLIPPIHGKHNDANLLSTFIFLIPWVQINLSVVAAL